MRPFSRPRASQIRDASEAGGAALLCVMRPHGFSYDFAATARSNVIARTRCCAVSQSEWKKGPAGLVSQTRLIVGHAPQRAVVRNATEQDGNADHAHDGDGDRNEPRRESSGRFLQMADRVE
jgi:hypothetical protein